MPAPAAFSVMIRTRAAVVEELRRLLPRLEGSRPAAAPAALAFGLAAVDSHLPQGGLPCGALHEAVAEADGTAAALGFIVALLARLCSPPQPNSGVPEFGQFQSDRSRKHPTSVGEGLGVGVARSRVNVNTLPSPPDPPPCPPPTSLHSGARQRGPGGGREKVFFVLPSYGQSARLYGHGLRALGLDPAGAILVETAHRRDTLWATEEALRSRAVAAVAGAIDKLDLKTSQRLHLAAADAGLPLFLLRQAQLLEASAAATRWRVGPAAAARDRFGLITHARWHLLLERCRNGRAGEWMVEYDHVAHRFSLAAALADPALPRGASEKYEKYEKSLATPY